MISEPIPIEQGLKLNVSRGDRNKQGISDPIPIEQGLKLSWKSGVIAIGFKTDATDDGSAVTRFYYGVIGKLQEGSYVFTSEKKRRWSFIH